MSSVDGYAGALERAKQLVSKFAPPEEAHSNGSLAGMKRPAQDDNGYANAEKRPMVNDRVAAAAEAAARISQKLGGIAPAGGQPQVDRVFTTEIKIPDRLVGLIIGKKGDQISSLQNESSCKVQIATEGGRQERAVSLTGNSKQVEHAIQLITDIIEKAGGTVTNNPGPPSMAPAGQPNGNIPAPSGGPPVIVEVMIPGNKAGLIIGKSGETIKQLQEENGVKMVLIQQSNAPSNEDKPLRITGDSARVEVAKQQVLEIISARTTGKGFGNGETQETLRYAVPAEKAGLVIGKGGESIKEIIRVSGSHVEISKEPTPDQNIKIFNIRGSRNEIEVAVRMISERAGIPMARPTGGAGGAANQWGSSQYSQGSSGGMPAPTYNAFTGQPDYSAAWAEYYRRQNMPDYADAILRQAQQQPAGAVGAVGAVGPAQPGQPQQAQPSMVHPGAQPQAAAAAVAGYPGQQQPQAAGYDYNSWWQWQAWQQQQQQAAWQQPGQPGGQHAGAPGGQPPSALPAGQ